MKKYLLSLTFLVIFSGSLFSQTRFGIRLAPNLAFNGVKDNIDGIDYKPNGFGVRLGGGLFTDISIKQNVYFTTGIGYTAKRIGVKVNDFKSVYNLGYIQVPVGLKFFTDEISKGMKIYFNVSGMVDIKVSEKLQGTDEVGLYNYAHNKNNVNFEKKDRALIFPLDLGILLGTGVEYQVADQTILFGGISVNRGFLNLVNPLIKENSSEKLVNKIKFKTTLINLDLGVKF